MKTMTMSTKHVHTGNLALVSARHPLRDGAFAGARTCLTNGADGVSLEKTAASVLSRMLSDMNCTGEIAAVSGYRSRGEQRGIYLSSLVEHGAEFTASYVALPGCSEHETGLAVDLALRKADIDFLRPEFPYSGVCGAFRRRAPGYGFVERYAFDKQSVTGIAHEPWHFRYVGYPHSLIMTELDLSLEEYTDFVRQHSYDKEHCVFTRGGRRIEVFFVPENLQAIELPENMPVQVSGNNVDGFVVTLWGERDA